MASIKGTIFIGEKMFTITITKKTIEERPAGKDWELTGLDDPKYAYTPEIVKKRKVEQKIYEQTVEKINISNVIIAVNNEQAKPIIADD